MGDIKVIILATVIFKVTCFLNCMQVILIIR